VTILDPEPRPPPGKTKAGMVLCTNFTVSKNKKGENSWSEYGVPKDHFTDENGRPIKAKDKKQVTLGEIAAHRGVLLVWGEYLWRKPLAGEKARLEPLMVVRRERVALAKKNADKAEAAKAKKSLSAAGPAKPKKKVPR
jgi:hypothetical protein